MKISVQLPPELVEISATNSTFVDAVAGATSVKRHRKATVICVPHVDVLNTGEVSARSKVVKVGVPVNLACHWPNGVSWAICQLSVEVHPRGKLVRSQPSAKVVVQASVYRV